MTISRILDPGVFIAGPRNTSLNLEYQPNVAQRVKPGGQLHSFSQWSMTIDANPFEWLNHNHKNGRETVSGRTLSTLSKYANYRPIYPLKIGIVDHAFAVAAQDGTRLHVKLLAIRRTHSLQSPM